MFAKKKKEKRKLLVYTTPLLRIEIEARNRFFIFPFFFFLSLSISLRNESIVSIRPHLLCSVILFYLTIYIFSRTLPHIRRRSEPGDRNADLEGSLRSFRRNLVSPLNLAH